jgi:type II secretory pathway pseudopilin PulG
MLELLVAIAMIVLVAGSLYASLYAGFKAHRSATSVVEPARTAALTFDLLREDFDAALPPTGVLVGAFTVYPGGAGLNNNGLGSSGAGNTGFGSMGMGNSAFGNNSAGNNNTGSNSASNNALLEFFSCAHLPKDGETACDIRQVDLALETPQGETDQALVRRITTNLLASSVPVVHEQVLCRHVKSFTLRFYDGITWQDTWDSPSLGDVLPLAVEVTLEFSLGVERPGSGERTYRLVEVFSIPCGTGVLSD